MPPKCRIPTPQPGVHNAPNVETNKAPSPPINQWDGGRRRPIGEARDPPSAGSNVLNQESLQPLGERAFDAAKLKKLRANFKPNGGTVTAGHASSISDGAAAIVLVSEEKARELRLHVIAKIRGFADVAQVL
ncbi:hypothetical protein HN51_046943 [Arachis hypogaea]